MKTASIATRILGLILRLWRELAKFGTVGAVAFVIDSSVFLWLIRGPMDDSQLKAKVVAGAVATLFSWMANRYWTFRHHRTKTKFRELMMFLLMNAIGLGIQTACVGISKYILGLDSVSQVFIAGNVIGLVLATSFRFVAYKLWVFTGEDTHAQKEAAPGHAVAQDGEPKDTAAINAAASQPGADPHPLVLAEVQAEMAPGPRMLADRDIFTGEVPVVGFGNREESARKNPDSPHQE